MGVDYSKIDFYYKCRNCKLTLPNVEYHYGCLHCGKFLTREELLTLQLFTYTIDSQKLSSFFDKNEYLYSIVYELEKIGIVSGVSDRLTGMSGVPHTFDLVIYSSHNTPLIVVGILDLFPAGLKEEEDEAFVLSFISRSMDVKVTNKILICFLEVNQRIKQIANTYQIS